MKIGARLLIRETLAPVEYRKAFKNGKVDVWSAAGGHQRLHYLLLRRPMGRKRRRRQVRIQNPWTPEILRDVAEVVGRKCSRA